MSPGGSTPFGGIDHVVWEVQDLEAARGHFSRLGFTLTPPAEHPFGTGTSLAQFGSSFLELLTVVVPERVVPMADGHYSFSAHAARFLDAREGVSMLVLSSIDAAGDNRAWQRRGLRTFETVDFAREATLSDGSVVTVAFSIAFAVNPSMPEVAFFVCQQHAPEHFWKADFQKHANGASDIIQVTLIADSPADHREFFERLLIGGSVSSSPDRLLGQTPRGRIEVISPTRAAASFPKGALPDDSGVCGFAAVHVAVADLDETRRVLDAAGVSYFPEPSRVVVPAADAHGCALVLIPEGSDHAD